MNTPLDNAARSFFTTHVAILIATFMVCVTASNIEKNKIEAEDRALKESSESLAKALAEPPAPVILQDRYSDEQLDYSYTEKTIPEKKKPRRRIIVDEKPPVTPAD